MKRLKDQSGVALAAVILAIVVVSVLSATVLVASTSEVKQTTIEQKSTLAYYVAHSAVDALSSDVLSRISALRNQGDNISKAANVTVAKAAYDSTLDDFYATCVPRTGSYTHTVTIPNAFSSGSSYSVPVTVTTSSSTSGTDTTLAISMKATFTVNGITASSQVKIQALSQPTTSSFPSTIKITDTEFFSAPFVASGSMSLSSDKSVGSSTNRTVVGKSGMVTIKSITDPAQILSQFGITVQAGSGLGSYSASIKQSITTLSSSTINTNNGQFYDISGKNFNQNLQIKGINGMDVYLIDNDSSITLTGGGYFATNSGADVILIAPNATSVTITGNFFKSVPSGYNASCFYIFAPNAAVTCSGSFNGFYGAIFAANITIPDFNYGGSSKQYVVTYSKLSPSSNPAWDLDMTKAVQFSYDRFTSATQTWMQ